jgi:hypothetical protein
MLMPPASTVLAASALKLARQNVRDLDFMFFSPTKVNEGGMPRGLPALGDLPTARAVEFMR